MSTDNSGSLVKKPLRVAEKYFSLVEVSQQSPVLREEDEDEKKGAPVMAVAKPLAQNMRAGLRAAMGLKMSSVVKSRLVSETGITTVAGQTCYLALNLFTDAQALGEFTDFQALFREFRFNGVRLTYLPFTPYKVEAGINTSGRPIVFAIDPEDDATPSSFIQVFANVTNVIGVSQDSMKLNFRNPDKTWYSTFSTTNPLQPKLAVKVAMDSAAGISIPCGTLVLEYFVEFRARL